MNSLSKTTFSFAVLLTGFFFTIILPAQAQIDTDTENGVFTVYREVMDVSTPDVLVPTVVSVPLEIGPYYQDSFLVYEVNSGQVIGSQVITKGARIDAVARASTLPNQPMSQNLVDNNLRTTVDFDVVNEEVTTQQITLYGLPNQPITADRLEVALAPGVSLPLSIGIRAMIDGETKTVVSPINMRGTTIRFPEMTSGEWQITFTYIQPLRVAELSLLSSRGNTEFSRELRFLSQPNSSYRVYFNPDQSFGVNNSLESGNLTNDEGVVEATVLDVSPNPVYLPADVDNDGIRDEIDNCVDETNPQQIDINRNGRGDACEDFDRDGRMNTVDNCPNTPNRNQADEDGDGIGDACDGVESRVTERYVWVPWVGMGVAVVVIISLFALVGKRPEDPVHEESEEDDIQNQ